MRMSSHDSPSPTPDLTAFIADVRRLDKNARQIARSRPFADAKTSPVVGKKLRGALNELEESLSALLLATPAFLQGVEVAAAPRKLPKVAKSGSAAVPLKLDTTAALIEQGHLVAPAEFQALMGWSTRQAVWKAVDSHRVFYLDFMAERYFPKFYADAAYGRKNLEAVTKVLGDLPGGAKLQFFVTRKGSLGGETPLQALAAGRVAKVKDIAASFAEVG